MLYDRTKSRFDRSFPALAPVFAGARRPSRSGGVGAFGFSHSALYTVQTPYRLGCPNGDRVFHSAAGAHAHLRTVTWPVCAYAERYVVRRCLARTRTRTVRSLVCPLPGITQIMLELVRSRGIVHLWTGLAPTLWRDVPFSIMYVHSSLPLCRAAHLPLTAHSMPPSLLSLFSAQLLEFV
jgi:hypothetical protein